jgi:hypothetical protein
MKTRKTKNTKQPKWTPMKSCILPTKEISILDVRDCEFVILARSGPASAELWKVLKSFSRPGFAVGVK